MTDLTLSARIQAPDGWHELEDEANGLWLHSDSFATRATPRRNVSSDGDWIDGSFTRRSTRGNVLETVAVWCDGSTAFEFSTRFEALKSWFDQISYNFELTVGNAKESWVCPQPGEYTEDLNQVFRFATRGLLRVQVARLPHLTVVEV